MQRALLRRGSRVARLKAGLGDGLVEDVVETATRHPWFSVEIANVLVTHSCSHYRLATTVALALSTGIGADGGSAFSGAARLAHDTARSERIARDHLSQLVAKQWLSEVEHSILRGETRRTNPYQAVTPTLTAARWHE
jgi:hypothetical protein